MTRTSKYTIRSLLIFTTLALAVAYVPASESNPQPDPALDCPEPELHPDPITGTPTPLCQLLDAYGVADPAFAHLETHP